MTPYISIPLPDRISPTDAWAIARDAERAVSRRTGAIVEAAVTDLRPLTDTERTVLRLALDCAVSAARVTGTTLGPVVVAELQRLLDPANRPASLAETIADPDQYEDLTRPQEFAADAMAGEFGRSRVERQADGAVVITGMTDDVERRTVCIDRDGRERWRR